MNPVEIAWAGGLFEGEGHLGRNVERRSRIAALGMTDLDAVIRFRKALGFGVIDGPRTEGRNKPMWVWRVGAFEDVQATVAMLWPFLGRRRRIQAYQALGRFTEPVGLDDEAIAFRVDLRDELDRLNEQARARRWSAGNVTGTDSARGVWDWGPY